MIRVPTYEYDHANTEVPASLPPYPLPPLGGHGGGWWN